MIYATDAELLERDKELEALRALLTGAREGRGGIAVVEAPPGQGKTALLDVVRAAAGMRVLSATAAALQRDDAFGVVRALARPLLREPRLFTGAAAEARPVLEGRVETALTLEPRYSSLGALYELAANLAAERPLAIVVDDAHWADPGSLKALGLLARRVAELPIALVVASREPVPMAGAIVLRPRPLSHDAVAALLPCAAAPEFVAAARECTGGNPLLVRELCRTVAQDGYTGVAAEAPYVRRAVPRTLAGLVQGRLWRLPPSCLALARAVAALGERSTPRCAAALAGLDVALVVRAHASLAAAGLLDAGTLRFTHPMMREATLSGVIPATRSALHRRAAALLEQAGASEEEIAAQLLAAEPGHDPWAAGVLMRSGVRALAAGDTDAALHHLRRALAESTEPSGELLLALGFAEARAGDPSAHMRLDWAARMGDAETAARAELARARIVIP